MKPGSAKQAALLLLVAAAGAVIGFSLAMVKAKPADARPARALVALSKLTVDDAPGHWAARGFVEMVPPVHLPSNVAESDRIAVWLKIPDGGRIEVRTANGVNAVNRRPTLRFPAGTMAERVESVGDDVIDVRGTTLIADGELFHVLVPSGIGPRAPLVGWEWRRDDDDGQRAATSLLVRHLSTRRTAHDERAEKPALVEEYTKNNACAQCHTADKPVELDEARGIHRATDDSGWYVPLSVLSDVVPLEAHRPRDLNPADPFVVLECPGARPVEVVEDGAGGRRMSCAGGKVPLGVLDVRAALAKEDAHALAVCASRKYLWEHMDAQGRLAFVDVFAECGFY